MKKKNILRIIIILRPRRTLCWFSCSITGCEQTIYCLRHPKYAENEECGPVFSRCWQEIGAIVGHRTHNRAPGKPVLDWRESWRQNRVKARGFWNRSGKCTRWKIGSGERHLPIWFRTNCSPSKTKPPSLGNI